MQDLIQKDADEKQEEILYVDEETEKGIAAAMDDLKNGRLLVPIL